MGGFPRILIFFFSIHLISSAGCTSLTQQLYSEDSRPSIAIPLMAQTPALDMRMEEGEWEDTVEVNGSFTVADGSKAEGTYPFRMWVGATSDGLLIAAEVQNKTPNPLNTEHARWADALYVFFKTDDGPGLTSPSFYLVGFTEGESTWVGVGFWNGREWEGDSSGGGGELDESYRPSNGTWVRAAPGEGVTVFEIYTPRFPKHPIRNSLYLTPGAEFEMSLAYMRGGGPENESYSPDARGRFHWPHDTYPGEGYTPDGMYDPQDWLRFKLPDA